MSYLANSVVMVPPQVFGFNEETGHDNGFQKHLSGTQQEIRKQANTEFFNMVSKLEKYGVKVVLLEHNQIDTPDAVFPNNWFITDTNGNLFLFPMACNNRQKEVVPEVLTKALRASGFKVADIIDVRELSLTEQYLEGTGAMVFDHANNALYAARSLRCNEVLLEIAADRMGIDDVNCFDTQLSNGAPVYHTNVMMSIGRDYCILCSEVIPETQKSALSSALEGKLMIDISEEQLNAFCGNVLQIGNNAGESLLAMSESAFNAFDSHQIKQLEKVGKIVAFDVKTIEGIGGGSVRCMLAEIFNPTS